MRAGPATVLSGVWIRHFFTSRSAGCWPKTRELQDRYDSAPRLLLSREQRALERRQSRSERCSHPASSCLYRTRRESTAIHRLPKRGLTEADEQLFRKRGAGRKWIVSCDDEGFVSVCEPGSESGVAAATDENGKLTALTVEIADDAQVKGDRERALSLNL